MHFLQHKKIKQKTNMLCLKIKKDGENFVQFGRRWIFGRRRILRLRRKRRTLWSSKHYTSKLFEKRKRNGVACLLEGKIERRLSMLVDTTAYTCIDLYNHSSQNWNMLNAIEGRGRLMIADMCEFVCASNAKNNWKECYYIMCLTIFILKKFHKAW